MTNKLTLILIVVAGAIGCALGFWFDSGNVVIKYEEKEVPAIFKYEVNETVYVNSNASLGHWEQGKILSKISDGSYVVEYGNKKTKFTDEDLSKVSQ